MKKKNKIILYILIALIIVLVGYLVYSYLNRYKNSDNYNNTTNIVEDNNPNFVNFKGYKYLLPSGVYYEKIRNDGEELLHIYNNNDEWGATIRLLDKMKYEPEIFDDSNKLEELLKNNHKDVKNRKDLNNKTIIFELYGIDNSGLLAYLQGYDNYEYEIVLYAGDDVSMNYEALAKIIDILENGTNNE